MYERRLHSELMKTGAERDRADSGYQNAREALERMLNKLDDPRRANIPQLQALRREQQHELVQFLEKVTATATSSKDSKILQDVATALYTSGRLRLALGEIDQSRQDLQRSINLLNELQQQLPEDVSLQMQKAASLQALAATYPLGESNLQLNEDAMNIQSRVVKQEPDNHSYQQKLAITFHNLGSNHIRLQNFEKAEAFLIKSLEVLNQISIHESRSYQVEIAETEINLSLVYEMLKKSSLAEEYIIRALQRLESILQSDSQNIRVLLSLSALRINRANMLASRTRHAEALKLLDINLRDLRELLQKEPELKDIKDRLFETQGSRGNILSLLQRHSEAAAAFEDVIRFAEPQQADFYQLFLASNRSKVGEYRLSLVACQQAARYDGMNYEQKTFLAMIYCNNVSWITRDTSLAVSEKTSLCQQCHDQALRWLNEARIQAGETAWKKFKHALFWEPLWKPMREYPPIWNWVKQS